MKNFSYFWKLNWVVAVALFCCYLSSAEWNTDGAANTDWDLSFWQLNTVPWGYATLLAHDNHHHPLTWHKDAHLHVISPHGIPWGFLSSAAKHRQSGAAQFFGLLLLTFVAPWVLSLDKWWLSKKPIPPWFHSWADTFSSTLGLRSPWFGL